MKSFFQKCVFLLSLSLLVSCAGLSRPNGEGWITLFDKSSNLNQWTQVSSANWRIQHGVLQADLLNSKDASFLVHKTKFKDFQIYSEFWADAQTNSGIFIRCANPEKITAVDCYEVNIWDTRPGQEYATGAIVDVAKVNPIHKAGGRWNTMEIIANGSQLKVSMNGVVTSEANNSKFSEGPIALQSAGGIIKFRKLEIKPI